MEDQQIIAGIRRGEVELFAHLVERYHRPLLTFINKITRDRLLTEDVGQAVFLAFFRALDTFDETRPAPVAAWRVADMPSSAYPALFRNPCVRPRRRNIRD